MERILLLFYNNGSFFTFVGLQLVCLYLIVNYNSDQNAIAVETLTIRGGKIKSFYTGIGEYLDLREQDEVHRREIARLWGRLPEAQYDTKAERDSLEDGRYLQRYTYLATRIVNRKPYNPNNTLVIDRGEKFGVVPGQGLMDSQGLLGVVDKATPNHARALSILHQSVRISAGLKNRHYGTLRWDGHDPRYMTLVDLPDYVKVTPGDTVFTTGFSNIFPTGQVIGTVASKEVQPGTGNQHLRVQLINEPLTAAAAYVVQDLFKEELGTLNGNGQ